MSGFELQSITWNAPASLLKKLAQYEAVHAVRHWSDIKTGWLQIGAAMHFFITKCQMSPSSMSGLHWLKAFPTNAGTADVRHREVEEPNEADLRYSTISNAQAGLKGISFGNFP